MNEAVWVGDKDERTVYANPKFCKMLGYKLEDIIGEKSYIFWDDESVKKVKHTNATKRKAGISSSYEGNLKTKKGKLIPVLLNGTPLPDGGTIGIMTDLTELKKKESLYKNLIENMKEAVWLGDKDENTIYANPEFCKLMGYSLEEMIGKESYYFWDKESSERVKKINRTKRKAGESSTYEGNLLTKSGEQIPVLVSGTPTNDGGTIGIITDLRELKEKEENERILNSAIKLATDAIIVYDDKGNITSWNKGAKIMFGYKEEEIMNQPIDTIFKKKDALEMIKPDVALFNIELTAKHKNKSKVILSATLTPVYDDEGNRSDFHLIMCRDITNQTRYEEELTLKYEKMKDAYNKFGILRRQNDYIFEALELVNSDNDKKSIADYIVSSIIMLSRVDACTLRVYDKKTDKLQTISSFGVGNDWEGKKVTKFKNSLYEKAFLQGKPLKIIDLAKEPKYESKFLAKKNNFCSLLLIPLVFKSEFVGCLSLYTGTDKKLEIFENEFIEKYSKVIEILVGTMLIE